MQYNIDSSYRVTIAILLLFLRAGGGSEDMETESVDFSSPSAPPSVSSYGYEFDQAAAASSSSAYYSHFSPAPFLAAPPPQPLCYKSHGDTATGAFDAPPSAHESYSLPHFPAAGSGELAAQRHRRASLPVQRHTET